MDGFASQQHDADFPLDDAEMDAPPIVRFDERRMHVRAYNYWAAILGDRQFPSIEDLNPQEIEDFGSHSVLLDFTHGVENPGLAFIGSALARECGVGKISRISDVPPRTLLSRLTDHYLQILANRAPIGFEAEFTNQRDAEILYRGILMPFSTNGEDIDFVYGVINWKEVADVALTSDIERAVSAAMTAPVAAPAGTGPIWADGPAARPVAGRGMADEAEPDTLCLALADARDAAADARAAEGRSHQALYRALSLAHAFALASRERPADYARLLDEASLVLSPRAPMTALAKLVFGADYDRTRLSEYAAVIDHAVARGVAAGALEQDIAAHPGGVKALVRAARQARRGEAPAADPLASARARLACARAIVPDEIEADTDGLAVVVVRRSGDRVDILGGLPGGDRRVASILKSVAKRA